MPGYPSREQQIETNRFETQFLQSAKAIKLAVWGDPWPYEDEFWRAKFDDYSTIAPYWSWATFCDWVRRYEDR